VRRRHVFLGLFLCAAAWAPAQASPSSDETSSSDKLRILYSNRFTFTDGGLPLVTVEVMGGQSKVELSATGGLAALPDGEGGAEVSSGSSWTLSVRNASPAKVKEWTIVEELAPDNEDAVEIAIQSWKKRGYRPRSFETGTLFGVEGEVIDSRKVLIGVAPQSSGGGSAKARAIAKKHGIGTTVHRQLVRRPRGTIVAQSGSTVIRNPSVIWFSPDKDKATIRVENVVVGGGGSQLETSREDREYFGLVYVTVGRDGKLVVANAVSAKDLLAGLVPSEIFATAPMEALSAQAVAARTELLEKLGTRHFGDPFLVCSSQHCQVYSGAGKEHPRTTRAVEDTRGMVLLRESGGIADARYSAACGGHSEHNDHIWGGERDESLRGHVDAAASSSLTKNYERITNSNVGSFLAEKTGAYCSATRWSKNRYRWKKAVSKSDLSRRVAKQYPRVGPIQQLEALERGVSGRISKLRIRGDETVTVTGDLHIRRLLGGLRSTLFQVKLEGDQFVFHGAGFGHGVGMCQLGAIGMAEKRNSFREILHHYYPATRLHRLY
jgi:SpoIID/LytB domain protein